MPGEISQRMVEKIKPEEKIEQKKLAKGEIEQGANDLAELILERRDLEEQIRSDNQILNKKDDKPVSVKKLEKKENSFSPDDLLAALNDPEALSKLNWSGISRQVLPDQGIKSSCRAAEERLQEIKQKIAELAGQEKIAEVYREKMEEKMATFQLAINIDGFKKVIENVNLSEAKLLAHRNDENIKQSKADEEIIKKYTLIKTKAQERIEELKSDPDVYRESNRREMVKYRRQYLKGKIVETPSVKEQESQILGHLQLGIPVFLRGHLGAGKTEIAMHIAWKYYGVEPEFISGSEEGSKYDMFTKMQIGIKPKEDRIKEFDERMAEIKQLELSFEDIEKIKKEYYKEIIVEGKVTSFSQYGPLVRAMKEGKPLIIDEMDGIPHSILMRLNHILTRRVGNKFKIQENGSEEIEIKKGFCVIATGNIKSAKYKREDLDAAFLSRWWSSEVKYLPEEETYKILIASLIDKRGDLELERKEDLADIKKLTQAATYIQGVFTGEKYDDKLEGGNAARGVSASLEKSVLSMRDLWNIVKPWKAAGFCQPLEKYILTEFIKKATVPGDAIRLAQIFCQYRFFSDWKAEDFGISGLTQAKIESHQPTKQKTI